MMKRIYVSLLISICTIMAQAQTIAGYEYWFDNHFDSRSSQNTASGSVSNRKRYHKLQPGSTPTQLQDKKLRKLME